MQSDPSHPPGCLYALSAATCLPQSPRAHEAVLALRSNDRAQLALCVRRGVEAGDLASDTDVDALAAVFHSFMLGVSTLIRDGVGADALERAVRQVMTAWDAAGPTAVAVDAPSVSRARPTVVRASA